MSEKTTLLVIPHFRDVRRLTPFLAELVETLPASFSVLVSDDGSPAGEQAALQRLLESAGKPDGPVILSALLASENRGKGAAVYAGWIEGLRRGFDRLAFVDADGAVSAREILRGHSFWNDHAGEFDVLVGSRRKAPGRVVKRRWIRHVCGRVFARMVSLLTGLSIHDTQCGYKVLRAEAFEGIREDLKGTGFAFDVEMLLLLQQRGFRLREFPVDWTDIEDGKVSVMKASLPMLVEVVQFRRRIRRRK